MTKPTDSSSTPHSGASQQPQTIIIQQTEPRGRGRGWIIRLLMIALLISVVCNFGLLATYKEYYSNTTFPREAFHSGEQHAPDKIAILKISGTIMPPFTERTLKAIKKIRNDDAIKGVILQIDSPGGLVADSHQIYHRLKELSNEKPMVVSMKRLAASGGYYVAMGAGPKAKIYAEPTTWTGSIGVILPRYNLAEFAQKHGLKSEPLTTGPFKDTLNPFRDMRPDETELWRKILDESFSKFVGVITENRSELDEAAVRQLATGQIYTADQALENKMIDAIGFEEDVIQDLKETLGLEKARIVTYYHPYTMFDMLAGSVKAQQPEQTWQTLLDATVPKAMYFFSWAPTIPANSVSQ